MASPVPFRATAKVHPRPSKNKRFIGTLIEGAAHHEKQLEGANFSSALASHPADPSEGVVEAVASVVGAQDPLQPPARIWREEKTAIAGSSLLQRLGHDANPFGYVAGKVPLWYARGNGYIDRVGKREPDPMFSLGKGKKHFRCLTRLEKGA